jgi:molybdenum cofactor cytidylyltransferase
MKAETVEIEQSTGRTLHAPIFSPAGKKRLATGHILRPEDILFLHSAGMKQIRVAQLEKGEVSENEAVCAVAAETACGSCEIQLAPGGRANLIATESCCVLVDHDLLCRVNCTSGVAIATAMNFSYATSGQRIATVKSSPFAVSQSNLDGLLNMLKECGPILQARPVAGVKVAALYCDPTSGDRARKLFESVLRQKMERFGVRSNLSLAVLENEQDVSRGLQYLLQSEPVVILVASTTAPAGPEDAIGQAMIEIGCKIERFLAPVEPGNLLLMSYRDNIPILSAPGCFRSLHTPNVIDLLLPPLLARYRVSSFEIAGLGHGGLFS